MSYARKDDPEVEDPGVVPYIPRKTVEKCPLGICDGSGIVSEGEHDNIRDVKCPHVKEESGDDQLQDP